MEWGVGSAGAVVRAGTSPSRGVQQHLRRPGVVLGPRKSRTGSRVGPRRRVARTSGKVTPLYIPSDCHFLPIMQPRKSYCRQRLDSDIVSDTWTETAVPQRNIGLSTVSQRALSSRHPRSSIPMQTEERPGNGAQQGRTRQSRFETKALLCEAGVQFYRQTTSKHHRELI